MYTALIVLVVPLDQYSFSISQLLLTNVLILHLENFFSKVQWQWRVLRIKDAGFRALIIVTLKSPEDKEKPTKSDISVKKAWHLTMICWKLGWGGGRQARDHGRPPREGEQDGGVQERHEEAGYKEPREHWGDHCLFVNETVLVVMCLCYFFQVQ